MMRKMLAVLAMVAVLVLALVPAAAQDVSALLRFVHVVPGATAIDVYVDSELSVADLAYGSASLYIPVSGGSHTIVVTQAGVTTPLWQQVVTTTDGAAVTLVASSTDPLTFTTFQDDLNPLPLGKARLTAIHAIAGGPTVDVVLADGRAVIPGLQYGVPYGTLDVPSAVYEVAVVPEGEAVASAIIPVTALKLNSSTSYMVVAYGTPADPRVTVLSAAAQPEGADAFAGTYLRVAHGVAGGPEVDVVANDVVIAPSMAFGEATAFLPLAAGDVSVALRLPGSTDDVVSADLELEGSGDYLTAVALGSVEDIAIEVFGSDIAGLSSQQAGISLINGLADGSISAALADGMIVADPVSAGGAASAAAAPSDLSIVLSTDVSDATIEIPAPIYGGVLYGVVAVAGDGGPAFFALPPESIAMDIESAPGDDTMMSEVAAEPTAAPTTEPAAEPTAAPEPAAAAATATPEPAAPVATTAPAAPAAEGNPTARVLTDPGVNVHIRQYPNSQALSLALISSGSILEVLGRPGEPTFPVGVTDPSATPFVDPATLLAGPNDDLEPADTWLFVSYTAADGGTITGWINALYLETTNPDGEETRLADLPLLPNNRAGAVNTSAVPTLLPTNEFEDVVVALIDQLNPGANLHLRRVPSTGGESLALIPAGTQLVVEGRLDTGEWLRVTYNGQTGWINSAFVSLTFNGDSVDVLNLIVLATPTPTPTLEPTAGA
jgi:hypothetical protein